MCGLTTCAWTGVDAACPHTRREPSRPRVTEDLGPRAVPTATGVVPRTQVTTRFSFPRNEDPTEELEKFQKVGNAAGRWDPGA